MLICAHTFEFNNKHLLLITYCKFNITISSDYYRLYSENTDILITSYYAKPIV